MEKTEMMKRYESETGESARDELYSGSMKLYMPTNDYIAWLEAKAAAYDRLMSGGKKTPKDVANFFGLPIALTPHGYWLVFHDKPWSNDYNWHSDCTQYEEFPRVLHSLDIDYAGNWEDSLTLPDGWREK